MKKLAVLISTCIMSFSLFAGGFNSRFVEVQINVPVTVSNNTFLLSDILVENLVLDLPVIAKEMPDSGFNVSTSINPFAALNFNFSRFHVAFKPEIDVYGSLNIDKSIFNLLGKGYTKGEIVKVNPDLYFESFANFGIEIGFYSKKLRLDINPNLFMPLAVVDSSGIMFKLQNTTDAKFVASSEGTASVYSLVDIEKIMNGDTSDLSMYSDSAYIFQQYSEHGGFDLASSFEFPINRALSVSGKVRIPIKPGKLNYAIDASMPFDAELSLSDLISDSENSEATEEVEQEEQTDLFTLAYRNDAEYAIHRPLKAMAYANFAPFGELLQLTGGVGVGVRRPFVNPQSYFEYYAGAKASVLGGILGAGISTEYTDQMYINQLNATFALRFIQVDAGIAVSSSSFVKSFNFSGVGAYIMISTGI